MKKTGLLLIALLLQLCVTLVIGTVVSYGSTNDRAPSGLIVWGLDFSGLNRDQVAAQLKERIPNSVTYEDQVFPLKAEQTHKVIEQWLDQVFPSSTGSKIADHLSSLVRSKNDISTDQLGMDRDETIDQLKAISGIINQPMLQATIAYKHGRLEKTEGKSGHEMDVEATWVKISQEHEYKQVEAVIREIPAQPSTADLAKINDILGDYTTYFNSQDVPRTQNVRIAAEAINDHLIPPGEVFSFNEVVGERTEAAGYLPAVVFVDKSMIKENGGGICQDSSTLFQAVRQANLAIEEQHTHSLPISYVLKGQDATVFYGLLDFRFRNDTQGYLLISARTGENWLRIRLFGLADDRHPTLKNPEGYPTSPVDWHLDPK